MKRLVGAAIVVLLARRPLNALRRLIADVRVLEAVGFSTVLAPVDRRSGSSPT